ncbi:MAG: response regulator [Elusimicrobia bacterium]|nr:response regulator [Elusimicrobiota bacterium]
MHGSVLIIDDDEDLSVILADFLQSKGFTVARAPDGATGLAKAREMLPDLITLDFNMPDENGVETYNRLRNNPETAVIPVIFFSSTLTGLIKRMVLENPRVKFLKKGCTPKELEQYVEEMMALPKPEPPPAPPPDRT